jgi:D-alanyl-D-alanine carboxypeptidase/D-alanyl-D-alanine-endopeptidase (penicillin-binding protein 4)
MKRTIVLIAIFIISGCSSTVLRQEPGPGSVRKSEIAKNIERLLPDTLFPPANAGIRIVSARTGELLYENNSAFLFTPASNEKLVTSIAALSALGPYFMLSTTVAVDTGSKRIYVRGGGDPMLLPDELDSLSAMLLIAWHPTGTVTLCYDVSLFDSVYYGKGWMWDDVTDPSGMGVSALNVNGNYVDVLVDGSGPIGGRPSLSVVPATSFVTVNNAAVIGDTLAGELTANRPMLRQTNDITITGSIPPGKKRRLSVAVWEPDRFAATLFAESLRRRGVKIGEIVRETVPPTAVRKASIDRRLDTVVTYMNKVSDNLSAECLIKTLGSVIQGGQGSWQTGTNEARKFLALNAIDTNAVVVADGSGLSRYNLTTARTLTTLLQSAYRNDRIFGTFYASLPVAGVDGTLARRMIGTSAEGRVHAKTGTIGGVSSLSGYVPIASGDTLIVSMLMQNFPAGARAYRAVQDSVVVWLSRRP